MDTEIEDDDPDDDPGNVVDPVTGLPRVLDRKCVTCVYRPGNLMHLHEGRLAQMEADANARDSWITCHKTLPADRSNPGWQAICRGYFDVNRTVSFGLRLAVALGGPVVVSLPDPPECPKIDHDTEGAP